MSLTTCVITNRSGPTEWKRTIWFWVRLIGPQTNAKKKIISWNGENFGKRKRHGIQKSDERCRDGKSRGRDWNWSESATAVQSRGSSPHLPQHFLWFPGNFLSRDFLQNFEKYELVKLGFFSWLLQKQSGMQSTGFYGLTLSIIKNWNSFLEFTLFLKEK